jgi:hypothetical protein
VDALGRLSHAEVSGEIFCMPGSACGGGTIPPEATARAYDLGGRMIAGGATRYEVDAEGWITSRTQSLEGGGSRVDTYGIVRSGGIVVEERFTQAEPVVYCVNRGAQRIRYEWGRLPREPLFVPRALTRLEGADYFGVVSSHHRSAGYTRHHRSVHHPRHPPP